MCPYLLLITAVNTIVLLLQVTTAGGVCSNGDIRLVNGANQFEGRIEVCLGNVWGTVCDDYWKLPTSKNAQVACRQLGHSDEGAMAIAADPNNFILPPFGQGTGPIFWDDVQCTGSEQRLEDCPHLTTPQGSTDCIHSEDIGIRCQPLPQETTTSSLSTVYNTTTLLIEQTTVPDNTDGLLIQQTTLPDNIDGFEGVFLSTGDSQNLDERPTTTVSPTEPNDLTAILTSPLSKVNPIIIGAAAGGAVVVIVILVVVVLLTLYVCVRCRNHHREKGVEVDMNTEDHNSLPVSEKQFMKEVVIINDGAVPGSGAMESNVCYESTVLKGERRPKLIIASNSIEMRATTWNVAYGSVSAGVRQSPQEVVYETISDAAVESREYYNNRQLVALGTQQ